MRDVFVNELLMHAKDDPRIMLVTGDLGFGVLHRFSEAAPRQFINAGIAEQNMTGMAAGLALTGKNVFTYSIGNFPTLRCLEQIRNDVAYHNLNVNIVAVGGGLSYGALGMSHHATEDLAILRALPNVRVFAPCDEFETREIVRLMVHSPGPTYLRLDKSKVSVDCDEILRPGSLRCLRGGNDIAIVGVGGVLEEAILASNQLREGGISCAVYSAYSIKPFDFQSVYEALRGFPAIITLEEHVPIGGLGSLVSEAFFVSGCVPERFMKMCLPDKYSSIVGSQSYLRQRFDIDSTGILTNAKEMLGNK